ncbi:MAG: Rieske 2Fe-2S domain-containing protein [Candidatus Sumerlaeota bacterium]
MAVSYKSISWDRQKRFYDLTFCAIVVVGIGAYVVAAVLTHPEITAETLIIRSTALAAIIMLQVILCIGPLARLNYRFTPLLYNRRHLGVTMFLLALVHGIFSILQFHGFGNANPLVSALTAYWHDYNPAHGASNFPFEVFGATALVILFVMAITSHDFWLKNLGASFWKAMHLMVYFAYASVIAHVALGVLQSERSVLGVFALCGDVAVVLALHIAAALKEKPLDNPDVAPESEGYVRACAVDEVEESKGKVVNIGTERVAVFRNQGRLYASSNVCRHQGGPLGEGRIIDGCITCPWHGWNYKVEDGVSPPPFHEVIPTYRLRVQAGFVYIHPDQNAAATVCQGASS